MGKSSTELPKGYAAITVHKDWGLEQELTMTAPLSWMKDVEELTFVKFMEGQPGPEDYILIFQLSQQEGKKAPGFWKLTRCDKLRSFNSHQASCQYIQDLASKGQIKGAYLVPDNLPDTGLNNFVPPIQQLQEQPAQSDDPNQAKTIASGSPPHTEFVENLSSETAPVEHPTNGLISIQSDLVPIQNLPIQNGTDILATKKDLIDALNLIFQQIKEEIAGLEKRTNKALASMDAKITNLQGQINEVKIVLTNNRKMSKNEKIIGFDEFCRKHKVPTPFLTKDDFLKFEVRIEGDLFEDLQQHFISTTDCYASVKHNCTTIFKRFFKKEVLACYVAKQLGVDKNKSIFKSTKFFVCLDGALLHVFAPRFDEDGKLDKRIPKYDDKILATAIGKVINDSFDWENGRGDRAKTSDASVTNGTGPPNKRRSNTTERDENSDVSPNTSPSKKKRSQEAEAPGTPVLRENSSVINAAEQSD